MEMWVKKGTNKPINTANSTIPNKLGDCSKQEIEIGSLDQIDALRKLNNIDFHRQLRNELIMIPIPKNLESWYNQYSSLNQGHYLDLAFERINHSSESIF